MEILRGKPTSVTAVQSDASYDQIMSIQEEEERVNKICHAIEL